MEQPLAVGTKVRYHGSHEYRHGVYEITSVEDNRLGVSCLEYPEYVDGVCYDLMPEGLAYSYRNRDEALFYVRRGSITPVEEVTA